MAQISASDSQPSQASATAEPQGGRREFLDLVQGLDAIVWEMDVPSFSFTFVSERAEHILGYAPSRWREEPGFWHDRLLHPEDRDWALDFCTAATREARDHELEYRAVHADGHVVWLRDLVRVVRGADGAAALLRGVMVDITREKQTLEALREREAQLAESQAIAGVGSWEWDVQADRITWSDEQYRLHGHEPLPAVTYDWFFSHIHPDDQPWLGAWMERVLVDGSSFEFPYRIVRPDGQVRWLYARGRMEMSPEGAPLRMIGTSQDITGRKEAEDARLASEESYRTIFDTSNDAIFVHDLETGAIVDVNRRACELSGVTREELLTRGLEIVGAGPPPFTPERALEHIRRAATGEPQRFEWCSIHPQTGEELWVEVSLQQVTIGEQDRLLALARDIRERKRAERALIASEEAYRTIFQHSAEGIWVHDARTGAMLDVNRAGCELYGYTFEEMMQLGHDALLYPGSPYTAERVGEYMARALAGESPRFEWMGRHKDGSEVWGEVTLRRVTIGGMDRILATVRDIKDRKHAEQTLLRANEELERRVAERTADLAAANRALEDEIAERRAAEDQLRRSEEHFRRLIENSSDYVMIVDASSAITYVAPSVQRVLGYTPEEMIGKRPVDMVHPADLPATMAAVEHILAHPGEIVTTEWRTRHRDGSWRVTEGVARTLAQDSGDEGIVANVRDVTEHKQAIEALRRSEEHFRRLIENSSDHIMIVDLTGAITYVGPSVERILGYTADEMQGKRPIDLVHPDDVPDVMAELQYIVSHPGEVRTNEFRIRHKDGSWRIFEHVARTLSPDSAAEGVVANGRDVTERRRAEAALAQAKEEAERANRAKSDFLSRMSHELRTPMNSILGFAQVLESEELSSRQDRCVQHILKAGRHLLQLINEVLEISRIEAGRQNLSLEPVRLSAVLQEALGLARPMAAQARVELEYLAHGSDDAYVWADRQRLSQVMLNLLANAIKYNRAGGRVRLSYAAEPEPRDGKALLRVRVEDTGPGIAASKRAELFTPFARLGAENSEVEGTGLGLALSQRLAEAMGGALMLESTGPEGSVFCLELQITQSPLERAEENGPAAHAKGVVAHEAAVLLYIEDNLANLSLVETILWERPKWRTIPALQGQIGVELAREHLPDLILLDLHLPDIRGDEVLARLREDERTARIPVIVISADATTSAIERLLQAGAAAFLTKPLDVREFLETVEALLRTPTRPS